MKNMYPDSSYCARCQEESSSIKQCCLKNLDKAKKTSRATWICPECDQDVSLAYVLYQESLQEIIDIGE